MIEKTRKILPCLDIRNGKVVKGVNFENIREMGDPVELATKYGAAGADALAFLDITKTKEKHGFYLDLISEITSNIEIPLFVGGGISTLKDINLILNAGASKVSIASAALTNPNFISDAASEFGHDKIIIALDVAQDLADNKYYAYTHGGQKKTDFEVFELIEKFDQIGVSAFLITGISFDGSKSGFDLAFFKEAGKRTNTTLIASGGAGKIEDFVDLFQKTNVEYSLAASIFHQNTVNIRELKQNLASKNINVNL
ncbi:MAG: imidazole glycerol phosphate synthase subunit HisF [Clostridiaceae bacterium]|nr:imidazole glycerol phosphate synthase subunit HisF [Clostridiaceae bacterium]